MPVVSKLIFVNYSIILKNVNSLGAILIAEDSEDDVFFLRRALKRAGVQNRLIVVANGKRIISYPKGENEYINRNACPLPCLVILDGRMPECAGIEVLRWLQKQDTALKSIPIGILTGFDEASMSQRALQLGAASCLTKPIKGEDLKDLCELLRDSKANINA